LVLAAGKDESRPHIGLVGDTYTVLLSGKDTAGRVCLIDMHIPANAPHQFHNSSDKDVRLLCICSPAGQEEFFEQVGVRVATRTSPPPKLDAEGEAAFRAKAGALVAKYKTEFLREA